MIGDAGNKVRLELLVGGSWRRAFSNLGQSDLLFDGTNQRLYNTDASVTRTVSYYRFPNVIPSIVESGSSSLASGEILGSNVNDVNVVIPPGIYMMVFTVTGFNYQILDKDLETMRLSNADLGALVSIGGTSQQEGAVKNTTAGTNTVYWQRMNLPALINRNEKQTVNIQNGSPFIMVNG